MPIIEMSGIPNSFDPLGSRGFTRVEYLQSTGVQWIDTGIKPSEFDEFEIQLLDLHGQQAGGNFFGIDENPAPKSISKAITVYPAGNCWFAYGNREVQYDSMAGQQGALMTYYLNSKDDRAYLYYRGRTLFCIRDGEVSDISMYLFRANGAAFQQTYLDNGLQIFYAWFKKDGNLLAHFVPAVDPKGVACMLELVSGVPFYNQGTGEFIIGPRI